jgi:TatD DNase family protein
MNLIDTHSHLYLPEFDNDRDETVKNALSAGISAMLLPNIDIQSVAPMMSAVNRFNGICFPMIGLHPTSVKEDWEQQFDEITKLLSLNSFIAIGEIGIDLYRDKTYIAEQINVFRQQLSLAIDNDLPVAIHSRNAFPEIFSVLGEFSGKNLRGVFHAFSGDTETARKAINMGFRLGIGGIVTFKNSGLDEVVKNIGPSHIILETDSPYLAPVPHRGKRNESSYICIINRKLADLFGMDPEEVASVTTKNATELFNL